jgi:pimeloyl-ACP methyl ester carboxylesterase
VWIVAILAFVLAGVGIVVFIGALITRNFSSTPQYIGADGDVLPGSIAEFKRVNIGGCSQALLIRGKSMDNPVLLYLHGGPGLPEMGVSRNLNAILEDYYTVVHWDQRGTGKSYSFFLDSKTMTVERLVQDTHEVTQYLKQRLGKDKIVLMGHSWGAGLGAVVAARYPQDYAAFIGMGQPVKPLESDRLSYAFTLKQAKKMGHAQALKDHERIDGYWSFKDKRYVSGMMVQKKWVQFFGGMMYGRQGMSLVFKNMMCREFSLFDWPAAVLGCRFSLNTLAAKAYTIDLMQKVPELQIPYILLEGRHDYNSVSSLAEEYFNALKAPEKQIHWFEKSAHWPNLEQPDLFHRIMIASSLSF